VGKSAVPPVRPHPGGLGLLVVVFFAGMVVTVYLSVLRVRYGEEIQSLRREAVTLAGDVRSLEARKAGMTSLSTIQSRAQGMGMVYPAQSPGVLVVRVAPDEIPASCREELRRRDRLVEGVEPSSMVFPGFGGGQP